MGLDEGVNHNPEVQKVFLGKFETLRIDCNLRDVACWLREREGRLLQEKAQRPTYAIGCKPRLF